MKKVFILHDRLTQESNDDAVDVLAQVEVISQTLVSLGYEYSVMPVSFNLDSLREMLQSNPCDFVFNLVETLEGHGRLIHLCPAMLDALGIEYTGSKTEAIFLTTSKVLTKKLLQSCGIKTPDWFTLKSLQYTNIVHPGLYIIKPVWEDGSVGLDEDSVLMIKSKEHLVETIHQYQNKLNQECFAEAYIDGREFNIALLSGGKEGVEVLHPAEIKFVEYPEDKIKVVGYKAKWHAQSFEYQHTPRFFDFSDKDQPLLSQLKEMAKKCWHLFELKGYARVDFRVDTKGIPWILEVNVNPCLSPDAGFYAAAERSGLSFKEVIDRIIRDIH
ncbi:MAG: ATP-grasp domain-containing protein [Candidatus Brocadiae bacterium]|nr:ATP-grasp domain-containing protein [Candidatus Brocadiia bacterium]